MISVEFCVTSVMNGKFKLNLSVLVFYGVELFEESDEEVKGFSKENGLGTIESSFFFV